MPLELAIAEAADRLCLAVLQVRNEADFRDGGRGPLGTNHAFERTEKGAKIGQLALGESLAADDQHRVACP